MIDPSPVEPFEFAGHRYWVKRDDLLAPISGNKARKLAWFFENPLPSIRRVVSHGGAQSNAMLALARLAKMKGWEFVWFTRPMPAWLRAHPAGNLRLALELGMDLQESPDPSAQAIDDPETLWIPQGVAMPEAAFGFRQLATEIMDFAGDHPGLVVFVPSGTGTSAWYLQRFLPIPVWTIPCVGDAGYLREQWAELRAKEPGQPEVREPVILPCVPQSFGQPHPEYLAVWKELRAAGLTFDLLYDPPGWMALREPAAAHDGPVLYVHGGGTEGNETMLARYEAPKR